MKILLSAFSCAPNVGSEAGGGWRWATELAKHHEVYVITDVTRKHLIEAALNEIDNPRIIYYRPTFLSKVPLNSYTAQSIYSLWQYSLLPFARRLHQEYQFDLAIHLTYGVFRHPSFLGFLGIPFVFGPVGGGEDAPWRLKASFTFREKVAEFLRATMNLSAKFNPFLWLALSRANLIFVRTSETAHALPPPFQRQAIVHQEIGTPAQHRTKVLSQRQDDEPLRILFAGRLLCWKGVHLALRAVAATRAAGINLHFSIIGSGPKAAELKLLAQNLGLDSSELNLVERVPQEELFSLYEDAHCFLFPSLHDSGGNVVLEAMSFGVPVICLDLGGPKTLVNDQCANIINTKNKSEAEVVKALADALTHLANNEPKRFLMSQAAIKRSSEMTWENRVMDAMAIIESTCFPAK